MEGNPGKTCWWTLRTAVGDLLRGPFLFSCIKLEACTPSGRGHIRTYMYPVHGRVEYHFYPDYGCPCSSCSHPERGVFYPGQRLWSMAQDHFAPDLGYQCHTHIGPVWCKLKINGWYHPGKNVVSFLWGLQILEAFSLFVEISTDPCSAVSAQGPLLLTRFTTVDLMSTVVAFKRTVICHHCWRDLWQCLREDKQNEVQVDVTGKARTCALCNWELLWHSSHRAEDTSSHTWKS